MVTYQYVITEELGIHARPAVMIAKNAAGFLCEVRIGDDQEMVDAKDVMRIMCLMLRAGDQLVLTFDGVDEVQASQAIIGLIEAHL